MTPASFLPPPWTRKLWARLLILIGYLPGVRRGYWYWKKGGELYWNRQQCRVFGINKPAALGTYESLFEAHLWDDDDREAVRHAVEMAMEHGTQFRHQFCIRDVTTGEKHIVEAVGQWLYDQHSGQPYAMWGYNKRRKLRAPEVIEREATLKLRHYLNKLDEAEMKKICGRASTPDRTPSGFFTSDGLHLHTPSHAGS